MMKNKITLKLLTLLIFTIALFSGCNEFNEPDPIYDPDRPATESPVISGIEPADFAKAGVRTIKINGTGLISDEDTTWIYIGGEAAVAKSATANQIVVDRPTVSGEDINIVVVIPSALTPASVSGYTIENCIEEWGDFSFQPYDLMCVESDLENNLFLGTRREIVRLDKNGIDITQVGSYGSAFSKITTLKFGPNGYLYAAISKNEIYTIDINTGQETVYADLPKKAEQLDFDSNGNLYAGRRDGIYVVNTDQTITFTEKHVDRSLVELRVFEDFLYVATKEFIYRNQIIDNKGTLGEDEVFLDLQAKSGFEFADISSISFDVNGMVILCIKNIPGYNLFVYATDGSITPYYVADIIPPTIDQVIYTNDRYMILNRGLTLDRDSVRVYRMGLENVGAPYYGRNL